MISLLILLFSFSAHASLLGPESYYVVQKENQDVYAKFEDGVTELIVLHRGQVVHLDGLYNARLEVNRLNGGRMIKGEIVVPRSDIPRVFGSPLTSSSGSERSLAVQPSSTRLGKMIRLDASPVDLANTSLPPRDSKHFYIPASQVSGPVEVQASKIVSYARGRVLLVHYACLSQPRSCGWIRNDQLARGARRLTATSDAGPDSASRKIPCVSRESTAQAASFAQDMIDTIKRLPSEEQLARQNVEDAVGPCVSKSPKPLKAYNGRMLKGGKQVGLNLYDAAPRAAAEAAFAKISKSAAKVRVREANGTSRPMTKEDFVTIDAFARTLFGEMRSDMCQKKPHIPAVARTIINRTNDLPGWAIEPGPHAKTPIMKVIVADRQYSVWNNEDEVGSDTANHDKNVHAAWCPSKNDSESKAWQVCIDSAMHAYLDQKAFLKETESLANATSYTSGRKTWPGHSPVTPIPSSYNDVFDDYRCMKFWKN